MSFIALAVGAGTLGLGAYEAVSSSGKKPNYSGVSSNYQQLAQLYPNLTNETTQAGDNIGAELQGQVPQDVINQIQNQGAKWGISSGMPLSGASGDQQLESLGLTSLGEEQQGQSNYLNFISGLGPEQMNPNLQADIATENAAPNPSGQTLANLALGISGDIFGGKFGSGGGVPGGGGGGSVYTGQYGSADNWSTPDYVGVGNGLSSGGSGSSSWLSSLLGDL